MNQEDINDLLDSSKPAWLVAQNTKTENGSFCAETNNGGDYIRIINYGNDTIKLDVGHQCAKVIDAIMPVDFLIAAIVNAVDDLGIESTICNIGYNSGHTKELLNKVRKINHAS